MPHLNKTNEDIPQFKNDRAGIRDWSEAHLWCRRTIPIDRYHYEDNGIDIDLL